MRSGLALLLTVWLPVLASAEPPASVVRLASVVPDGTGWARELRAMAREVETGTAGRVRLKLYFGAIAGDELQAGERIHRGQLDGVLSAGMFCERLTPAMRVLRVPGMFESREELTAVIGQLRPMLDKDFLDAGFTNLGETVIGPSILYTRNPIHNLDEMRQGHYWVWDADKMMNRLFPMFGLQIVSLPIQDAQRAYEEGKIDGFTGPPSAALGFQWSSTARYYVNLQLAYITGCVVVANRAFDALKVEDQQVLKSAAAKTSVRVADVSRQMDDQLLGGLFRRQGLTEVPVTAVFRAQFDDGARVARTELAKGDVPAALLKRVEAMVAEHRAQHHR